MKRTILIAVLAVTLTGCANLKFQWAASYQTENLAADMAAARAEQTKAREAGVP
jgi:PBP1b-binding outer membrane lipoprotein LpoB